MNRSQKSFIKTFIIRSISYFLYNLPYYFSVLLLNFTKDEEILQRSCSFFGNIFVSCPYPNTHTHISNLNIIVL